MSHRRTRRKTSLSTKIQDFDFGRFNPDDGCITFSRASADGKEYCTSEMQKGDEILPTLNKNNETNQCLFDLDPFQFQTPKQRDERQFAVVERQNSSRITQSDLQKHLYSCSVTPSLSSQSFYCRVEPVKLFGTPKTPPRTNASYDTLLSLGIASLLSPEDFLLSPNNILTAEETDATALLSDLETFLQSGVELSTPKNFGVRFLDTPQSVSDSQFSEDQSKSVGLQIDTKSIVSLMLAESITDKVRLNKETPEKQFDQRKMARKLSFETPCILRKRRRRTLCHQTENCENMIGIYKRTDLLNMHLPLLELEKSPLKVETPFTPSQFLNSPQMVTSTPVSNKARPMSSENLGSANICNTTIKSLFLNDLPRTRTPFKTAHKESDRRLHDIFDLLVTEEVDVQNDDDDDVDLLPFSTYTGPDPTAVHDPVLKAGSAEKGISNYMVTLTKSLDKPWPASGVSNIFTGPLISLETPSKSLIGDESLLFSPPSIIRDTLHEAFHFDQTTPPCSTHCCLGISENPQISLIGWERVACGQTLTQMELVKQARELLDNSTIHFRPRSLKL